MDTAKRSAPHSSRPVRVLSIGANELETVRFLGTYEGAMFHWNGKKTVPCPGVEKCSVAAHRAKLLWKGYAPVEAWTPEDQVWWPWVLEITEALEESFRGHALRGQAWCLSRPQPTKKITAVVGQYLETYDPSKLRPSFDCRPILQRVYPNDEICWGAANPIPPKVLMGPSADGPPAVVRQLVEQDQPKPLTEQDRERLREMMRKQGYVPRSDRNGTTKQPENGHASAQNGKQP